MSIQTKGPYWNRDLSWLANYLFQYWLQLSCWCTYSTPASNPLLAMITSTSPTSYSSAMRGNKFWLVFRLRIRLLLCTCRRWCGQTILVYFHSEEINTEIPSRINFFSALNYKLKPDAKADVFTQEWEVCSCSVNGHKNFMRLQGWMNFGANYL